MSPMVNEEWFWEIWREKNNFSGSFNKFWALTRQERGVFSITLICKLQKSLSASHFSVRISFKGMSHAQRYFVFQGSYFERIHALLLRRDQQFPWWIIHSREPEVLLWMGPQSSQATNFRLSPNFCPSFNTKFQVPCKPMCEPGWFRGVNKSPAITGNISNSCSNYLLKEAD